MGRFRDISGCRFKDVVAIRPNGKDSTGKTKWLCRCDCGVEFSTTMLNLTSGNTKSCGCKKYRKTRKNISGNSYGRLTAIDYVDYGDGIGRWLCICECGKEKIVKYNKLQTGKTRSCGCLSVENSKLMASKFFGKSGSDHPRWRSDYTEEDRSSFRGDEIKKWAEAVKDYYDYTCQRCLKRGVKLHSHHILSYAEHKKERTNPHNGICLCVDCHKAFHSTYGMNGFSIDDNIDFILKYQYGEGGN